MTATDDTELTEVTDMVTSSVRAVNRPANGTRWLMLKAAEPDVADAADPVAKAAGEPGDPDTPGSSTWEAADAAALRTIAAQLADLKSRIETSASRERTEAMTVDDADFDGAWDLDAACSALDCALKIVAAMAFDEAQESIEAGRDETSMVKAGKRLSTQSKTAIKTAQAALHNAHQSLTDLLGEDDEEPISKSETEEDLNMEKEELVELLESRDAELLKSIEETITKTVDDKLAASSAAASDTADAPAEPVAKAEGDTVAPDADAAATADPETPLIKAEDVDARVDEALTKALAPVEEMVKSLESKLDGVLSIPRAGGPALNDLASRAVQRGAVADTGYEDLAKSFEEAEPGSAEKARLGTEITRKRLLELNQQQP